MGPMSAKAKGGTLTEDERREWIAYARKRDLSASIGDQRVFRSRHPGDRGGMIVEIQGGRENRIDLEISSQ